MILKNVTVSADKATAVRKKFTSKNNNLTEGGSFKMILEKSIKELIAEKLDVDILDVISQAELINDLGADSLAMTELVMSVEAETDFKIEISDDEKDDLVTVQDLFDLIKKKIS